MAEKFGQHFLIDRKIIKKIVSLVPRGSNILEIGPGRGALTGQLIEKCGSAVCVEKDGTLAADLRKKYGKELNVITGDILEVRLAPPGKDFAVVGNLPYSITTEMIYRMADMEDWQRAVFTMQKEAAERLLAQPGASEYGKLSVTAGVFFVCKLEFTFSKDCFSPKPSVDAAVITLENKKTGFGVKEWRRFMNDCFFSKRKYLLSNLKRAGIIGADGMFKKLKIDLRSRPHQVSPEKFCKLFEGLDKDLLKNEDNG